MKITALIPNPENAVSMYRGMSVLDELHKIDYRVDVRYPERVYIPDEKNLPCQRKMGFSYMTSKGSDLIFALRPLVPVHMNFFEFSRKYNIPIITDYDDNLFEIPRSNQAWVECSGFDYKGNLRHALQSSAHVIVSTEILEKCFNRFNPNITTIRNAFDNYVYRLVEKRNNNGQGNKTVLWRGSSTHIKDLGVYRAEITALIYNNPDINFVFWSDQLPAWLYALDEEVNNIHIKQAVHPFEYWEHLTRLQADLVIVPLQDNIFNRCKSDIAKLEAVCTGALCISQDWTEWKWNVTPDEFMFSDNESFFNKTQMLINRIKTSEQDELLDMLHAKHIEYVKENRLLSEANKKRLEVFKAAQNQCG